MRSTKQTVALLARANPRESVTEDRIRQALRRGVVAAPALIAGRFVWTKDDVTSLAGALGLRSEVDAVPGDVTGGGGRASWRPGDAREG